MYLRGMQEKTSADGMELEENFIVKLFFKNVAVV